MYRREDEYIRDESRADYEAEKARYDASMGNYGEAARDEARSERDRMEAAGDLSGGHHHHHHNREGEYMAAEMAGTEIERDRERLRHIEMGGGGGAYGVPPGGAAPYYPQAPGYTVTTVTTEVPGGYPGGQYPQQQPGYPGYPGGAPGYPPY